VLGRFRNQIDFEKYLKHLFTETKVNQSMKSSEASNMSVGRMMAVSALIEAKVFINGTNLNQKILKVIVGCLIELYSSHDLLQESISVIFTKLLTILKDQREAGL
jgi:hypothetical protein